MRHLPFDDLRVNDRSRSLMELLWFATVLLAAWSGLPTVRSWSQTPDVKPTDLIGKRVVPKFSNFALKIDNQPVNQKQAIQIYIVESSGPEGLRLRGERDGVKGTASADNIISVDKALDFFTEQIRKNPDDGFSYFARSVIRSDARQEYDLALSDLDQAVRLTPSVETHVARGEIWQVIKKEYDKAIADYDRAIQLDPKHALILNDRGLAWYMKKEYDRAIADYNRAIQLDPKQSLVFSNRGLAWSMKKEYDSAIADFDEAIRLDPKFWASFKNRGLAWTRKKEYDKAIADCDRAIRLDPNQAEIFALRGIAWRFKEEYDKAIADYTEAIRLNPNDAGVYANRASAWQARKDDDKAIADYTEAIRLDPGSAAKYRYRANAFWTAGRYDDSFADTKDSLAMGGWHDKGSPYAAIIGHFAARRAGKLRDARAMLEDYKSKGDTTAWPYPIVRYLRGEIDSGALMAASTDKDKRTESHCYLGLDLLIKKKTAAAKDHLLWVKERGNPAFVEYAIAKAELDRLDAPRKAVTKPRTRLARHGFTESAVCRSFTLGVQ